MAAHSFSSGNRQFPGQKSWKEALKIYMDQIMVNPLI